MQSSQVTQSRYFGQIVLIMLMQLWGGRLHGVCGNNLFRWGGASGWNALRDSLDLVDLNAIALRPTLRVLLSIVIVKVRYALLLILDGRAATDGDARVVSTGLFHSVSAFRTPVSTICSAAAARRSMRFPALPPRC